MNLIPSINGPVRTMPGYCTLPRSMTYEGPCAEAAVKLFVNRARRLPGMGRLSVQKAEEGFLAFRTASSLPEEAYRLLIAGDGITCEASSQAGFSLALVTLYQLLAEEGPGLPCLYLEDSPRYPWRGFMLDVCRHFFSVDEVKKLLEQAALLKLNRFHWHLSDDQGYRIESKRFPRLNEISSWRAQTLGDGTPHGGYYTQEEIADVVAFAAQRGIELIPEIDLPGHTTAILAAYPELSCTGEPLAVAEHFGILERILCAGKEAVYAFLDELLEEVCGLFPSRYFHIGGDEAPKGEWEKCPDCRRALAAKGLADCEALQAYFTGRLVRLLKRHGKTAVAWNEALASGQLDGSVMAQYWVEWGPSYSMAEAERGRRFILSNLPNFYLDYPCAMIPLASQLAFTPNIQGQPLPDDAQVLGLEAPLWTEWLSTAPDMERMLFPRLLAVAERAWQSRPDPDAFLAACGGYLRYLDRAGIHHASMEEVTVHGQEGIRQIVDHFLFMSRSFAAEGGLISAAPEGLEQMKPRVRGFLAQFMASSYTDEEIDGAVDLFIARLLEK